MPTIQLSEVRLEYCPHGTGPERIVFLHGYQASARIWSPVQQALPADRYSSIAIHHRGAGLSDAPPDEEDFTIAKFANDAFELVNALGWSRFTLVGHSLGGATAAQFAVDHPGLLKGLVLLDPADPDGREFPGGAPALEKTLDSMMAMRRNQLAKRAPGDAIDASRSAAPRELMERLSEDMRNAPERRLRGSMRSMFNIRIGARVKTLPMPVLLAAGDKDELIPLATMLATWAKYPPGTGLHIWHGIGHSPNLECPAELAQLIQKFTG